MQYVSFSVDGNKLTISVVMNDLTPQTFETNINAGLSDADLEATALAFFDNCVQNIIE